MRAERPHEAKNLGLKTPGARSGAAREDFLRRAREWEKIGSNSARVPPFLPIFSNRARGNFYGNQSNSQWSGRPRSSR
jgi:hypothetical protein